MSSFDLNAKVAVITGGAGMIGTAIAHEFASAGAQVVIASRRQDSLDALASKIAATGGEVLAVACDITSQSDVEILCARTLDRFGRIDVLVNNAGVGGVLRRAEETRLEEWKYILECNITGAFNCCMKIGNHMILQKRGCIINVSSIAGTKGHPRLIHYSAAKAAMINLTTNLANTWSQYDINVNCIAPGRIVDRPPSAPGGVQSEADGVARLRLPPAPQDVATLARFLASPAASMITGETFPLRAWFPEDR